MKDRNDLSSRVGRSLAKQDMTLPELAQQLGMNLSMLARVLSNGGVAADVLAPRIARVLGGPARRWLHDYEPPALTFAED